MKKSLFLTGLALSLLAGCGVKLGDPTNKADTQVVRSAADEVKWISADVTDPRSEVSLLASTYRISNRSRLLARLSSLKPAANDILQEQPILFRVIYTIPDEEALARTQMKLCPLEKNWMLLATWSKAHPYREGQWRSEGGDFEEMNCISALAPTDERIGSGDEAKFCGGNGVVCFDLADWIMAQVRERGRDFGFVLVLDDAKGIKIYGDSSAYGPSVFWRKLRY